MRRIYESGAIRRDPDDPFSPGKAPDQEEPQAARHVPSRYLSNALIPKSLRSYAISVSVQSPAESYEPLTRVPFIVTMKNAMPFPITLETNSRLLWTWEVDGVEEASHVSLRDPGDEPGALKFSRGERKTFTRTWDQTFRITETEWEKAGPGEYTIGVSVNVDDADRRGLSDTVTVRLAGE